MAATLASSSISSIVLLAHERLELAASDLARRPATQRRITAKPRSSTLPGAVPMIIPRAKHSRSPPVAICGFPVRQSQYAAIHDAAAAFRLSGAGTCSTR